MGLGIGENRKDVQVVLLGDNPEMEGNAGGEQHRDPKGSQEGGVPIGKGKGQ